METFISVGQAAQYFKQSKVEPTGLRVILTGGPTGSESCMHQFTYRGVRVKVLSDLPNREIEFVKFDDARIKYQKAYKKSLAEKDDFLWRNRCHMLIPFGEPVYIEGNQTTLTRSLRKAGFTGRYSIWKAAGWMVKIHMDVKVNPETLATSILHIAINSTDIGLIRFKVGFVRTGNFPSNYKHFTGILGFKENINRPDTLFFQYKTKDLAELERKYKALKKLQGVASLSSKEVLATIKDL